MFVIEDKGDDDFGLRSIRLKDVFAPEMGQPGSFECKRFAEEWLAAHGDGTDWPFYLETFRTARSDVDIKTFSRYVGVITSAEGLSLNADLIKYIAANGFPRGIGG